MIHEGKSDWPETITLTEHIAIITLNLGLKRTENPKLLLNIPVSAEKIALRWGKRNDRIIGTVTVKCEHDPMYSRRIALLIRIGYVVWPEWIPNPPERLPPSSPWWKIPILTYWNPVDP